MSTLLLPLLLSPEPIDWSADVSARLRVIVTTDGEVDDTCSMIRFLLYGNEWDVRGIALSCSRSHWKGNAQTKPHHREGEEWIQRQLDAYASVYPNLLKHFPAFRHPDTLRSRVAVLPRS